MRWRGRRQSNNIDDRRGRSIMKSERGVGDGAAIILLLVGLFLGEDVQKILSLFVGSQGQ